MHDQAKSPRGRGTSSPAPGHSLQLDTFFRAIPVEGSLGLLALGAVGVLAWRKVRDAGAAGGAPADG